MSTQIAIKKLIRVVILDPPQHHTAHAQNQNCHSPLWQYDQVVNITRLPVTIPVSLKVMGSDGIYKCIHIILYLQNQMCPTMQITNNVKANQSFQVNSSHGEVVTKLTRHKAHK